jgi:prepilin-type processing-associated H-X9-DG protein
MVLFTLGAILFSAIIWFVYSANEAREHARSLGCQGHLTWLAVSILRYHQEHGHLPPAHVDTPDGSRTHSWRALVAAQEADAINPFPYDFSEPWNGPNNSNLGDSRSDAFACPSDSDTQRNKRLTNYFVIEGANTPFPGSHTRSIIDAQDYQSRSNTILVAEASGLGIEWLEPRDLDLDRMSFQLNDSKRLGISSVHPHGANACMADGSVRFLSEISPEVLEDMLGVGDRAWRKGP